MKKLNLKNVCLLCSFIMAFALVSCSSVGKRDDAVRIKPESVSKYNYNPSTKLIRNGSTLRGSVIKIEYVSGPDSCPITENTKYVTKGYVLFVDSSSKSITDIERIPLEDIDLVGLKTNLPKNKYGNVNYFETYNNPLLPRELKEVPVDTVEQDPCKVPCPCQPLNIGLPGINLKCPDRELSWWFFEVKPGFALYNDVNEKDEKVGKDDWMMDIAAGIRFGSSKKWGLGLILSSGVKVFDHYDSTSYKRMNLALYARYDLFRNTKRVSDTKKSMDSMRVIEQMTMYDTVTFKIKDPITCQERDSVNIRSYIKPSEVMKYQEKLQEMYQEFEVRPCLNPFIYGLLGASIDKFSVDLFDLNFATGCKSKIDASGGDIDIAMPINYGFGVGVEIPICKSFDISADLGFRSISYGERIVSGGYIVPTNKRINSFVFRFGIAY